ncbi:ANKRD17, partial [Symbiodinium pilosum]
HANGTPDHKEEMRYKSVGGYFILIARVEILDGKPVHVSSRGLSPCIVLLEEALTGEVDLRNWPEVIKQRRDHQSEPDSGECSLQGEKKHEERSRRREAKQQNIKYKRRVVKERLDLAEGRAKELILGADEGDEE